MCAMWRAAAAVASLLPARQQTLLARAGKFLHKSNGLAGHLKPHWLALSMRHEAFAAAEQVPAANTSAASASMLRGR